MKKFKEILNKEDLINYFEGYKILSNTMIELTIKKSVSKFCSPYNLRKLSNVF